MIDILLIKIKIESQISTLRNTRRKRSLFWINKTFTDFFLQNVMLEKTLKHRNCSITK